MTTKKIKIKKDPKKDQLQNDLKLKRTFLVSSTHDLSKLTEFMKDEIYN
ncbi:MAG: hypothetical protein KC646_17835 [Candidatus Cloacimonetes bacterium]|nr:hypothetical protein [Candidatus Cloacimonadota bacterium]